MSRNESNPLCLAIRRALHTRRATGLDSFASVVDRQPRAGISLAALALAPVLMAALPQPAAAQTWTGNTSSDWTVGSNWSTGTVPTTGNVTIDRNTPNPTVVGVSGAATATMGILTMGATAGTSSLTIQNGSTLSSVAAGANILGRNTGGNATVTVTGPGSAWSTAASTILGNGSSATATLNIANGAAVSIANNLTLGQPGIVGGDAVLNVTSGGTLTTTGNATLFRRGGNSTANISGTGSKWSVGGFLVVGSGITGGSSGTSVLNVDNGGVVTVAGAVTIGGLSLSSGGLGTVTLTGAGSQLSSGGALNIGQFGTGTLTISNGATATANTVTLAAGSSGRGTLNLDGGGTLVSQALTGGPGQARQVNFDGGTLRATGSNTAFISDFSGTELNIAAGGLVLDTAGFGVTAASPFTGVGALTKAGSGTAVLTGDNSYTGGTTISAGTLQLGDGGTTGTIVGNVVDDGTLAFNRSDAYTFAGVISGNGGVVQAGSGTTVLTGGNTYTGGTTISAGTLQLGDGGTTGSIVGDVVDDGTLAFNRSDAYTFAGVISGSGRVVQAGSGTTVLSGNNTYAGGTTITGGAVSVAHDGNLGQAGSTLTLDGGALRNTGNFSSTRAVTLGAGGGTFQTVADLSLQGVIGGAGALTKTEDGKLTLIGDNGYTGGTTISAGTLQLGDGGATGSIVGNAVNDGTLAFNRAGTYVFDGVISGSGAIRQIGPGLTTLTGDSGGFAGTTSIEAGALSVNGRLCGDVDVLAGGRLQGTGTVCNTHNFAGGTVTPGNSIGTLTVAGNYVGSGGTLEIEAELGGDNAPTDRLVVTGDTAGSTNVRVVNLGGTGAQTVEGMKIVDIGGTSNGTFSLVGDYVFEGDPAVVAGAYAYRLYKNGVSTPNDGDWYLRSTLTESHENPQPLYQPGVPLYEAYAGALQSFNGLGTLYQRMGNRAWSDPSVNDGLQSGEGLWMQAEGTTGRYRPEVTSSGVKYDLDGWKLEAGVDTALVEGASGVLVGSVGLHYGRVESDASSVYGDGRIDIEGHGLMGAMTWFGGNGVYVDGQARVTRYYGDLHSRALEAALADRNDGQGYAAGVEAGRRFATGEKWSLTPQVQLNYARFSFDAFEDAFGARVSLQSDRSLMGRLGLTADYRNTWQGAAGAGSSRLYGIANLYREFADGTRVEVDDTQLSTRNERLWGGLGFGGTVDWGDGRYAVFGQVEARTGLEHFGDSHAVTGTAGLRMRW